MTTVHVELSLIAQAINAEARANLPGMKYAPALRGAYITRAQMLRETAAILRREREARDADAKQGAR